MKLRSATLSATVTAPVVTTYRNTLFLILDFNIKKKKKKKKKNNNVALQNRNGFH